MTATTTTTRKQLRGLGLSRYLAREVTRNLTPVEQNGQGFSYSTREVVASMRVYAQKSRVKILTRNTLETVSTQLLSVIGNRIPVEFRKSSNWELGKYAKQALKQLRKTDRALATLKLDVAEILAEFTTSGELH